MEDRIFIRSLWCDLLKLFEDGDRSGVPRETAHQSDNVGFGLGDELEVSDSSRSDRIKCSPDVVDLCSESRVAAIDGQEVVGHLFR